MEFGWSEAEIEFRRMLEEFVGENLPTTWNRSAGSLGSSEWSPETGEFCRRMAEAGLLVPSWPEEYGGQAAGPWRQQILAEVMWGHGEPRGPQYMNVNWIGPALIRFGTDEQKSRYLPDMAAGRVVWCQGFSEPDAGSDLASLRTRATRYGDVYVVNGQKIWTSYARDASTCFLLVRTDPEAHRHRGLSVLLVPMDTPGIELRPIASIVGTHAFHELFFTDVEVPESQRLGPEHEGWRVVRYALANERVGLPRYIRAVEVLRRVTEATRKAGRLDRHALLRIVDIHARCEAARLLVYGVVDERTRGDEPSGRAYVARAAVVECERAVADLATELLGPEGVFGENLADVQQRNALAVGVASGTYEIQLGLIAETMLGLERA
jgi:alkylation response protein AidB-like acyl-CoA dehydrogenase